MKRSHGNGSTINTLNQRLRASITALPRNGISLLVVILVGIAGSYLLTQSHAATPTAATETENGTVSSAANTVTDQTASAGHAVRFGSTLASGSRTCPTYPQMPTASCTGVPAGTNLTTVNSDYTTSSDGQLVDAKLINGDLIIANKNVTVSNTRIKGRVITNVDKGLLIKDSDIGLDACPASGSDYTTIAAGDYTLLRTHVHNNGADLTGWHGGGTVLFQDSILDHACFYTNDHLDGAQFYDPGGVGNVTVNHTIIDVRPDNSTDKGNSAIFWADAPGAGSRLTVSNSQLAGGNWMIDPYNAGTGSGIIINVHDNIFVKGSNAIAGDACDLGGDIPAEHSPTVPFNGTEGLKWTNNTWSDGAAIPSC